MKKTVLYKEIDGHKVIMGFDLPTIDPVATAAIVDPLLKASDEWQAVEAKKAEYVAAINNMRAAAHRNAAVEYKAAIEAMAVRQDEIKPLARALADKLFALRRENAVHFTPRAGEVAKAAEVVDGLIQATQGRAQGTLIALDGSVIENNRGKVYFKRVSGKWRRTHIVRLGDKVPTGATLEAAVTDAQRLEIEADRVAALPADIKLKERERAMAAAIKGAADMRSRLEIQADPDALAKSQDWYRDEVARIEALYG